MNYQLGNNGKTINKQNFSEVLRNAYLDTVKPDIIINAFKGSGIYPPNQSAIDGRKIAPSKVYSRPLANSTGTLPLGQVGKQLALKALKEELDESTLELYKQRYAENYELQTDPVYNTWIKLQQCQKQPLADITNRVPPLQEIREVLDVPHVQKQQNKTVTRGTCHQPKHLSSEEMISYLEEKK